MFRFWQKKILFSVSSPSATFSRAPYASTLNELQTLNETRECWTFAIYIRFCFLVFFLLVFRENWEIRESRSRHVCKTFLKTFFLRKDVVRMKIRERAASLSCPARARDLNQLKARTSIKAFSRSYQQLNDCTRNVKLRNLLYNDSSKVSSLISRECFESFFSFRFYISQASGRSEKC